MSRPASPSCFSELIDQPKSWEKEKVENHDTMENCGAEASISELFRLPLAELQRRSSKIMVKSLKEMVKVLSKWGERALFCFVSQVRSRGYYSRNLKNVYANDILHLRVESVHLGLTW